MKGREREENEKKEIHGGKKRDSKKQKGSNTII